MTYEELMAANKTAHGHVLGTVLNDFIWSPLSPRDEKIKALQLVFSMYGPRENANGFTLNVYIEQLRLAGYGLE